MVDVDLAPRAEPFIPGDAVAVVEVFNGKVWTVRPVTVIQDMADEVVLWLAGNTVTSYPAGPQHGTHTVQHWLAGTWDMIDRIWQPPGKLMISRPSEAFDVSVTPTPVLNGASSDWYVNLQEPLRRCACGFRTMDHTLDIVVSHDLTNWRWKDEDEFTYAQQTGLYSRRHAAQIRATGERIIEALEHGAPHWDPRWAAWSPPSNAGGSTTDQSRR